MLLSIRCRYYLICVYSAFFFLIGWQSTTSFFTTKWPQTAKDDETHERQLQQPVVVHQRRKQQHHTQINDNNYKNQTQQQLYQLDYRRSINKTNSRFAYAFLVAGCDPKRPTYRGFLYNVLVSTHVLQSHGSKADVVLLVQMSHSSSSSSSATAGATTALPREEEKMLHEMGIRIHYLPTTTSSGTDTFYSAMMSKFAILDLIEYDRVLYMDADIMPLCNLDHLFHLSIMGVVLKENLIVTWWKEPASGGFFMLTPGRGEWQRLQNIILNANQHNMSRHGAHFDPIQGWGHIIQPPDYWMTLLGQRGTNWTFQFAFADQGLLYHWVKYVKRSVSIVFGPEVWNWSNERNGQFVLEKHADALQNYTCHKFPWESVNGSEVAVMTKPIYRDMKHFTGSRKPWVQWKKVGLPPKISNANAARNPYHLWFHILRTLQRQRQWPIDVENLNVGGKPILGKYPTLYQMAQHYRRHVDFDTRTVQ